MPTGATVLLLGANGAGKSTLLSAVMGLVRKRGSIVAFGYDISRERPESIARRGVYLIPEGRGTLGQLTVEETFGSEAITFPRGTGHRSSRESSTCSPRSPTAGTSSRARSAVASSRNWPSRALLFGPRLSLDEPSLGLAPLIVDDLYKTLKDLIADTGISVLLVEQHAEHGLDIADRVHVLEVGRIAFSGTAESVRGSDALKAAI